MSSWTCFILLIERTNIFAGGHFLNKKYQHLSIVVNNIVYAIFIMLQKTINVLSEVFKIFSRVAEKWRYEISKLSLG